MLCIYDCWVISDEKKISGHSLMIPPFTCHIPIKISIPIKAFLLLFFACSLYFAIFICANEVSTMKVHPLQKKRSITTTFFESSQTLMGKTTMTHQQKKLRRLPHIFSRVLELPLKSDADVSVEESSDFFRFVALTDGDYDVRAETIVIHPGVVKIVIRGSSDDDELLQHNELGLELDMWRFRLPASTRPERASAVCVDGELVVTVPKRGDVEGGEEEVWGEVGRLVLVQ